MQTVLANLILAHPPLAALISNRAHWDEIPQGQPANRVVMYVVGGVTDYTMKGASGYVMTRVQFDCRGDTAAIARSVANALSDRLSGFTGQFQGFFFQGCFAQGQRTRSEKDGPSKGFTDSRDFTIHWAPA